MFPCIIEVILLSWVYADFPRESLPLALLKITKCWWEFAGFSWPIASQDCFFWGSRGRKEMGQGMILSFYWDRLVLSLATTFLVWAFHCIPFIVGSCWWILLFLSFFFILLNFDWRRIFSTDLILCLCRRSMNYTLCFLNGAIIKNKTAICAIGMFLFLCFLF